MLFASSTQFIFIFKTSQPNRYLYPGNHFDHEILFMLILSSN